MDSYKKFYDISKSYSQAFEQFNSFEKLYGSSFHKLAQDMLNQEKLIRESLTPFYLSYQDIFSSLQPQIEKFRELHLSCASLYFINEANLGLSSIFSEQQNLAKILGETASLNSCWLKEIESVKHLATDMSAAKLALHSHFDEIAQATLLAQERLINSPWVNLEKNLFHDIREFQIALESFDNFTDSYNSLIQSFKIQERHLVDFPPFVSGLPPIEVLTGADLLDSLSRSSDTEQYVEEADALELEIREDIETSLEELLGYVNPEIGRLWQGAKQALVSSNPDKNRHVVVSLREMLTHILHAIAPDSEVSKWTSKPSHFHNDRPTREARLLYICRDINHGPFEQFMNKDVDAHVKFIRLFQRGTHEVVIDFTEQQLKTLLIRTESLARFLLITWKNVQ